MKFMESYFSPQDAAKITSCFSKVEQLHFDNLSLEEMEDLAHDYLQYIQ